MLEINVVLERATQRFEYDLSVEAGERILVSGPSGAGKSTLLDLIAGFEAASQGEIRWQGRTLSELPVAKRPVSYLFQSGNLFDHLSALENVKLGLDRKSPERAHRAREALDRVGLTGRLQSAKPGDLSGGQRQRVAFARVLLMDRPILLLDEPFTGLDAETADAMVDLLTVLTKEGRWTVFLVSHDPALITRFATRCVGVRVGRITDFG